MSLPIFNALFQPVSKDFSLLQTTWAALINPILNRVQNTSNILDDVVLAIGTNVINHKLGRKLKGWKIVRQSAVASLYDTQATNPTPDLTLRLVSSAVVTISIEVF